MNTAILSTLIFLAVAGLFVALVLRLAGKVNDLSPFEVKGKESAKGTRLIGNVRIGSTVYQASLRWKLEESAVLFVMEGPFLGSPKRFYRVPKTQITFVSGEKWNVLIRDGQKEIKCAFPSSFAL